MNNVVLAEFSNRTLALIAIVIFSKSIYQITDIMWILAAGNAIQLVLMLLFSRKYIRFKPQFNKNIWKKIINRSWPIGASIFFNLIYLRGDIIFLSLYRPDNEIGIYGAAYKVVDVVAAIPVMYMGVALPLLTAAYSRHDNKKLKNILQKSFDFFSLIAIPTIFGSIAIGTPLMTSIFGKEFALSGDILSILGPAIAVVFFGSLFGHTIVAINKQKPMTWGYFAVAVLTVAGYMYWIPAFGIWAAAWLTLFSEFLIALLTFIVVKKVTNFSPNLKIAGISLMSSLIMFIFLITTPTMPILADFILAIIIYFTAVKILGGPSLTTLITLLRTN